ncbi:condensation domain-containing protein, partial [Mucilaginibacter sp. RCC_168]|uniref:condensation domain-containing protein n=1 Tax=Mucilaginibacter sp. RCC_168 TaxID=3239221 RepID=UPI0035267F3D
MESVGRSFESLLERHEILRTTIVTIDGEPRQQVHRSEGYGFEVEYEDLRSFPDREKIAGQVISTRSSELFDLEKGPLFRCILLQMEAERTLFLLVLHHIIADGWSIEVFFNDLIKLYTAYEKGEENPLQPLRIQYKDYAAWTNGELSGEQSNIHRDYWLNQFKEKIDPIRLPFYQAEREPRNGSN